MSLNALLIIKNLNCKNLRFLAKTCNSMVIELCKDILRVSQRIQGCQILKMKKNIEL
jgi:hypothetical protein